MLLINLTSSFILSLEQPSGLATPSKESMNTNICPSYDYKMNWSKTKDIFITN